MNDKHPQLQELLVLRATEGLDEAQTKQLAALLQEHGAGESVDMDLAAAAAANAFALQHAQQFEDAPQSLKDRLARDANSYFAPDKVVPIRARQAPEPRRVNWGWATAAMLGMVLIVGSLVNRTPAPASAFDARAALLEIEGTVTISWSPPDRAEYAAVSGDVVWNDALQKGYMLLSGMPSNDPDVSQYQLWVVDPARDANPVDGGVFNIPEGVGQVVIPIDARLAVSKPAAFAITREKPGGVVVSDGPLLVVAATG